MEERVERRDSDDEGRRVRGGGIFHSAIISSSVLFVLPTYLQVFAGQLSRLQPILERLCFRTINAADLLLQGELLRKTRLLP